MNASFLALWPQWMQDLVVTDVSNGLHYRNLSVYLCHQRGESGVDIKLPTPWGKIYTGSSAPEEEDMLSYLQTGVSSPEFLSRLRDVPPDDVTPRYGAPLAHILCESSMNSERECIKMTLRTRNFPKECRQLSVSLSDFHPSLDVDYSATVASSTTETTSSTAEVQDVLADECRSTIIKQDVLDGMGLFKTFFSLTTSESSAQAVKARGDLDIQSQLGCEESYSCSFPGYCAANRFPVGDQCLVPLKALIISLYRANIPMNISASPFSMGMYSHGNFFLVETDDYLSNDGPAAFALFTAHASARRDGDFMEFWGHASLTAKSFGDLFTATFLCVCLFRS